MCFHQTPRIGRDNMCSHIYIHIYVFYFGMLECNTVVRKTTLFMAMGGSLL